MILRLSKPAKFTPSGYSQSLITMSEKRVVSKSEFEAFTRRYEADQKEIRTLLDSISRNVARSSPMVDKRDSINANSIQAFEGVLTHPKSGRSSKQSSFVNVAASLRTGIDLYNQNLTSVDDKIITAEFDGSLLSWTHNTMASVRGIVGRYSDMNSALGTASLEEVRKTDRYKTKPFKYNRDVSSILREIRKIVPIVVLAKGDWAARELLKNTFQNSKAANTRNCKELEKVTNGERVEKTKCEPVKNKISETPSRRQEQLVDCEKEREGKNNDSINNDKESCLSSSSQEDDGLLGRRLEQGLKKMVNRRRGKKRSSQVDLSAPIRKTGSRTTRKISTTRKSDVFKAAHAVRSNGKRKSKQTRNQNVKTMDRNIGEKRSHSYVATSSKSTGNNKRFSKTYVVNDESSEHTDENGSFSNGGDTLSQFEQSDRNET